MNVVSSLYVDWSDYMNLIYLGLFVMGVIIVGRIFVLSMGYLFYFCCKRIGEAVK
jgi:hypothetical protein